MVFLEIFVVAEHLSPEVDAKSVRGLRWGLGYLWRPFPFWRRWGGKRIRRLVWGHSDLGCSCFPFWRWRGRRRIRRLFWRLVRNRNPPHVSPFGGRWSLRRRGLGRLDWLFWPSPTFWFRRGRGVSGTLGASISAWGSAAFLPLRFGGSTGVSTGSTSAIWFFEIRYENFTTAVDRWRKLPSSGRLVS